MKKSALRLAAIPSIVLFAATSLHSAEQKIIFNSESIKYESGTGSVRCQEKCGKRSGPDAGSLLSEGWKIVSSTPKEVIGEEFWYVPCNTCEPHGCTCIGTEYVLEKEGPAPNVETPISELELLKKKNELLLREIASLKRENENLKNQLRGKQKTVNDR